MFKPIIMNLKIMLTLFCVIASVGFTSCSDDESGVEEQFSFEDETLSVKDANVYLTYKATIDDRLQTKYVITDGTFDADEGGFVNETYNIAIFLYTPEDDESYSPGEYRQLFQLSDAPASSNVSYMLATSESGDMDFRLETPENTEAEPIRVSGGFDDDETITFKYSGDLDSYSWNEDDVLVTERVSVSFTIKGKIQDITSSLVITRGRGE